MKIETIQATDKSKVLSWFESFLDDHLKWWQNSFASDPTKRKSLDQKQWNMLLKASEDPTEYVKVARINDQPAGIVFAVIKEDEWLDCLVGHLYWIAVDPAYTNQGIATKLLESVEEWFKEKRVKGKSLNVSSHNLQAIALYRNFGYDIVDYRMLGPGTQP